MANDRQAKGMVPAPYPLAMIVCDGIWRDPSTGKRTILGCFSTVRSAQFPVVHPAMAVYVALTEVRGLVPLRLVLVGPAGDAHPLVEAETAADFSDPMTIVEIDFHLTAVQFDQPGEYRFELYAGSQPVMARRFVVSEKLDGRGA